MAEELQISDFDYDLPSDLIAQFPCEPRDQARLLVVERSTGCLRHHRMADLPQLLQPPDLMVVNNTRVLPARLYGQRVRTGGKWEGLFLRQASSGPWEMLSQSKGKLVEGEELAISGTPLRLTYRGRSPEGHFFMEPSEPGTPEALLELYGHVPIPPYIRDGRDASLDRKHYQTVFAQQAGAVAAPTAGLHFTTELLVQLEKQGICKAEVTLHVGIGTFQPVKVEKLSDHQIHAEWCSVPAETVTAIKCCRQKKGRLLAVGTTTVRTLESVAATGPLRPWSGFTDLFIRPPYTFRTVDLLLTNFHLPRSTLLVLVSAFASPELIRAAYQEAIQHRYRFYSYGDAMLIV